MVRWLRLSARRVGPLALVVAGTWISSAFARPPDATVPRVEEPATDQAETRPPESAPPAAEPASAPAQTEADEATARGRQAYLRGVAQARNEQWGDALAAFLDAEAARNAPLVQYNITYCLRALGRYVAANRRAERVLRNPEGLAPSQIDDLRAYVGEFARLVVHVDVTLEPASALLSVDGRPLLRQAPGAAVFLGSLAAPGKATSPGMESFQVVLDPGVHLFRAARPGHQDAVVRRSYRPGQRAKLDLRLDVLPATIAVRSEPREAIVRLDDREVGLAPIEFQRPAGSYQLEVVMDDYDPYSAELDLAPGQRADLTAKLVPYETPIYERWWFWTSAAAVVTGGVLLTYFLTRPEPEPPPYDEGNTGWLVTPQALRF